MKTNKNNSLKRFLIIWIGQFISSIGSGLTAFAIGVYAFQKTNSAVVYSAIILFAFLPSYILKPIGGTLSDRFNRRLMMIIGDLGSAAGIVFILIMFYYALEEMWVIYTGVILSSLFVALQNPAYKASITDLLSEENYSKASGLMQLSEASRFLISPIVAGFLFHVMNIESILLIDISTFLVAVIAIFTVKEKLKQEQQKSQEDFFTDLKAGFRYTFSNKSLVGLISVISLITFSIGFLQALIGPMILSFTEAKTLGIMQTISASGMLAGSLFIGMSGKSKNLVKVLYLSLLFSGIFYSLFGSSTNLFIIVISGFLFFTTLPFVNTSLEVLIRKNTDNNLQGRVWSIVSLISQLGMVIAFGISGFLADKIFNPLLVKEGILASSIGRIIGIGEGRGIGFMFILSGIILSITALWISRLKMIRSLETSDP